MNHKLLKLTEIIPYENNPREYAATVPALKESIQRYGYNVPIVVDADHVIITGHARRQALVELGYEEAMVIVADLTPEKAREWRLIDNKAGEQSTWDRDKLVAELRTLEGKMDAFFDDTELKSMLGGLEEIGRRTIKEGAVEAADARVKSHFRELADAKNERTTFITCQHCGQKFGFDKPAS